MKQFSSVFTTVLASALVFILLSFCQPYAASFTRAQAETSIPNAAAQAAPTRTSAAQPGCDASRSIQVSGTAVVNVTPDRASIQLGVQSNGATTKAVEDANSAAILSVIHAIRAQGVEAKDISTDRYIIEPIYDSYDSLYIKGYRIYNTVAITLRDVNKTSQVIAAALNAGANQVQNVDFYTSELRKYRDQAREMAIKAAGEKARALASAAGAETGCVLTISENSYSYYNGWWFGRSQNMSQMTQNVVQNIAPTSSASSGSSEEPISLGQISVKAEVNASFGLK